jgi:nucleoside diphosphate kinase
MEYSLFMIKPCAYEKKDKILDIISKHLNILFKRDIVLNENLLNKLYKNEQNLKFKKINIEQLKNGKACIGIVGGKNAIKDLIKICGDKPLGSMCGEETIRYKFSPPNDVVNIGNDVFFQNAIHKSDSEDAIEDVIFFIIEFLQEEIKKCNINYSLEDNWTEEK